MTPSTSPSATGQEGRAGDLFAIKPKRLDVRHLRRAAERAITRRLGYWQADTIRSVERDGRDVVITLNSGGNAIEVENELRGRGYNITESGGCTVRVLSP